MQFHGVRKDSNKGLWDSTEVRGAADFGGDGKAMAPSCVAPPTFLWKALASTRGRSQPSLLLPFCRNCHPWVGKSAATLQKPGRPSRATSSVSACM